MRQARELHPSRMGAVIGKYVSLVFEDEEAVTFERDDVVIREKEHGVEITPSPRKENNLGFHRAFWPWREIRSIKEHDDPGYSR